MKRISTPKIILALCIINIYLFIYGVVGEIGDYKVSAEDEISSTQTDDETDTNAIGTVDFLIVEEDEATTTTAKEIIKVPAMSWYKPSFADYTFITDITSITSPQEETESEETTTSDFDELSFDEPTEDEIDELPSTSTAVTSTTTTVPATTTTVPETTTTPAVPETTKATTTYKEISVDDDIIIETIKTTDAETEPEPVSTPSPSSGSDVTLKVSNGGVIESGKAVDIISRIVANEIGGSFDVEAIKAQAVASYTFVMYFNQNNSVPSVLLKDTVPDKVYKAVSEVIGQAVYYNDKLIQAVYSASSAGFSASSVNVWGSDVPYLRSVECELDAKYDPNYGVVRSISADIIKQNVENVTGIKLSGDKKDWLKVESREDGQYVAQLVVGGKRTYMDGTRERTINGRVFRELIMNFGIRSAAFDVHYDEDSDSFMFTTYGYGHGVGMSQNGAQILAVQKGYNYVQILQHYYTGCEVY